VVSTYFALFVEHFAGERTKPALHAIADDRPTDFLGNGYAQPLGRVFIFSVSHKQHKALGRDPLGRIGGEKIAPLENRDQAESLLRPRARRARITARPPGVDIRARKP
jgi:hypothetical protein